MGDRLVVRGEGRGDRVVKVALAGEYRSWGGNILNDAGLGKGEGRVERSAQRNWT